ncbi:MAG: hypothetical protein GX611_04545 [Clostridiales bacterium]|nr:hypothetical protein [Clostridiales bacterium]
MKASIIKACACLLILVLLAPAASATTSKAVIDMVSKTAGDSSLNYPEITGMDNSFVQDQINQAIVEHITPHLNTFTVLQSGTPGQLVLSGEAFILPSTDGHDLLSILFTAEGRMPNGRTGYQQLPLQFDLANGQEVTADQLFTNKEEARTHLEDLVDALFMDDLSNYLDLSALRPLPLERLLIDATGISFFYPEDSLTWLSGRPASFHFLFHEIQDLMNLEEGSFLHSLGVLNRMHTNEHTGKAIEEAARSGKLPGLAVTLGEKLETAIKRHSLLYDPEGFADGEKYQLEDDRFRGSVLISFDRDTIAGVLSRRMNLSGLITGASTQADALLALGQPAVSLPLGEDAAALYGLPEGNMDIYPFEPNELRLVYDQEDQLIAIWMQTIK